eukprot:Nk52_evm11s621 gene=Nk52_evmTU11s621
MSTSGYMNLKSFHPGTKRNVKRVWLAEQRAKEEKKRLEERDKILKEERAELQSKSYLDKEEYAHLSVEDAEKKQTLSFMYKPPPGYEDKKLKIDEKKKEELTKDSKLEEKFEFLKNAPRSNRKKDFGELGVGVVKPFGKQVINVKCMKCGIWGHNNTSKECPKFGESESGPRLQYDDPLQLMKAMEEGSGLKLSRGAERDIIQRPLAVNSGKLPENQTFVHEDFVDSETKEF